MDTANTSQNDIVFLKRLLFLKASLDNDGPLSNQPVLFNDDKVFKPDALSETGIQSEEAQLMIHSGEDGPLLQLMPPPERFARQAQTANAKIRPIRGQSDRASKTKYNSLNLTGTALAPKDDQKPFLLGRIEQNKFVTNFDIKAEQEKEDAIRRKALLDKKFDHIYAPMVDNE